MWKKILPPSVTLFCLCGMVACEKVENLVSDVSGDSAPQERRAGINKVHNASVADIKDWLDEPNVLVVLDFYSDSCPPCLVLNPLLDKMAEKYGDKAAIMKLNVGKPGDIATVAMNEYKISQTPVLKFYLNGEEVKEMNGEEATKLEELDLVFNKYTSKINGKNYTMLEGDMPGMKAEKTVEEMMVREQRGKLPEGIVRTKIPDEAPDVTEGLPEKVLNAGPAPGPTLPQKQ